MGFPKVACFRGIDVGEDKIEDVGIPVRGMSLDAFLDVLDPLSAGASHMVTNGKHTSGSSSQSDMLSVGKMIVFAPARLAATVFSRNPPMRRTLPVTVSSPVMAMVGSRGLFNARDSNDEAMVMPAEGPERYELCTDQKYA